MELHGQNIQILQLHLCQYVLCTAISAKAEQTRVNHVHNLYYSAHWVKPMTLHIQTAQCRHDNNVTPNTTTTADRLSPTARSPLPAIWPLFQVAPYLQQHGQCLKRLASYSSISTSCSWLCTPCSSVTSIAPPSNVDPCCLVKKLWGTQS